MMTFVEYCNFRKKHLRNIASRLMMKGNHPWRIRQHVERKYRMFHDRDEAAYQKYEDYLKWVEMTNG